MEYFGTLCMIIQAGRQQDLRERERNENLHCEIIYIMQHVAEELVRALSLSFDVEDWTERQTLLKAETHKGILN